MDTAQCSRPGLELGPLDPDSSHALNRDATAPPMLAYLYLYFFPFQYNKDKYEVKQAKKRNGKGQNIAS